MTPCGGLCQVAAVLTCQRTRLIESSRSRALTACLRCQCCHAGQGPNRPSQDEGPRGANPEPFHDGQPSPVATRERPEHVVSPTTVPTHTRVRTATRRFSDDQPSEGSPSGLPSAAAARGEDRSASGGREAPKAPTARACHIGHSAPGPAPGGSPEATDSFTALTAWDHKFPSADLVNASTRMLPGIADGVGDLREGPRFLITVGPGLVQVSGRDWPRRDATAERAHRVAGQRADDRLAGEYDADALLAAVCGGLVSGRDAARTLGHVYATAASVDRERLAQTVSEWLDDAVAGAAVTIELADLLAHLSEPAVGGRIIREWSRTSRARMVMRICSLDFGPMFAHADRVPVMITATYPGDWLAVAPDGRTCNRDHWDLLRKRYARVWDEPALAVWKREFQARGAPHYHAHMAPPTHATTYVVTDRTWSILTDPADDTARLLGVTPLLDDPSERRVRSLFRGWLSVAWAEIVEHPNRDEYRRHMRAGTGVDVAEGLRATDPKRLGVYFTKHGIAAGKEYQNLPPDEWPEDVSVGRFWGVWGLVPALSTVQVHGDDAVVVARTLRRYSHAQRRYVVRTRPRAPGGRVRGRNNHDVLGAAGVVRAEDGPVSYRRVRLRAVALARGRGWVSLNDGPSVAARVGAWLTGIKARQVPPTSVDQRLAAGRLDELRAARARRMGE